MAGERVAEGLLDRIRLGVRARFEGVTGSRSSACRCSPENIEFPFLPISIILMVSECRYTAR